MEFGNLIPDLIQHILFLIPLKPRTRLKLVSKDWCIVITRIRESTSLTTSYGLVTASDKYSRRKDRFRYKEITFITLQDHAKEEILLDSSLKVITFPHNFGLVGSSNGLLLYVKELELYVVEFLVFDPITKQGMWIPSTGDPILDLCVGFSYDEIKKHFKITRMGVHDDVHGFLITFSKTRIEIFSSETWKWDEVTEYPWSTYSFDKKHKKYPIFSDGKMFFQYRVYLTIYDVWKNSCDHVFAKDKIDFAWVSEGKVWSCYCLKRRVIIRVIQHNGKWKHTNSINDHEWHAAIDKIPKSILSDEEKKNKYYKVLSKAENDPYCEFFDPMPFNFNEDLQTLYFKYFGMVYGYSFETKKLTMVWIDISKEKFDPWRHTFSFLLKPVDISHFGNRLSSNHHL